MTENKSVKYRAFVENQLNHMRRYKLDKHQANTASEFLEDQKSIISPYSLEPEDYENIQFNEFFEIGWNNCENKDEAIRLLKQHLSTIKAKFNQSNVIPEIIIYYQYLNQTAKVGFEKNKEAYVEALKLICIKRTKSCQKSCGKVMDLVPIEKRFDKFGPWQNDPLQNHLKVYLVLPDEREDFPDNWRTDEKVTKYDVKLYDEENEEHSILNNSNNNEEITLTAFLKSELDLTDSALERIEKMFNEKLIYTVEDLTMITDWDDFRDLPAHRQKLQISIERYKNVLGSGGQMKLTDKRTTAELANDWHKVQMFLFYESGMSEFKTLGFLDKSALTAGIKEQKSDADFDGGPILDDIERVMRQFAEPAKPLRKPSHGLLLYGPPGTGKTQLCTVIINKTGLFALVPPLSSSELNRSKVGETEQLLIAIFHRALYVPYLLCCIAIDEIDALTPKRTEKSAEHKIDTLCLLLSLIGGIKDVPNVFVIASTNRLNTIDDAFARRLQDKFYVGRLNAEQRFNLLMKIFQDNVQVARKFKTSADTYFKNNVALFNLLTTNFSGAAMVTLRSQILFFFDTNHDNEKVTELNDRELMRICDKVANDFKIKIGGYSIPALLESSSKINKMLDIFKSRFDSRTLNSLSGRILIDLRAEIKNIQFELIDGSIEELNLEKEKKFTSDIVQVILIMAIHFKVPYFQLIDSNLLLANLAFDENTSIEMILERLGEYEQYKNAMMAFDVDTLVGVSESMSDSAMNSESLSYSIQNSRVWQQVILHSFKSQFAKPGDKMEEHPWCIFISSSAFLIDQFKKLAKFELCSYEYNLKIKERVCINCGATYTQSENGNEACVYHKEKVLTSMTRLPNGSIQKLTATLEDILRIAVREGNNDAYSRYYYLCCMKRADQADGGCQKGFHKERQTSQVRRTHNTNTMLTI